MPVRPFLALLLSLMIFGAVGGYLRFLHELRTELARQKRHEAAEIVSQDTFALEITLTFDAGGGSAFTLDPSQSVAVWVKFRGRDLLRVDESIAAGTPLRVENIEGIVAGANEFYIEAHPSSQGLPVAHAVRVRILRNGHPVADESLWSEPGLPVRGTVRIDVHENSDKHEHKQI